MSQESTPEIHIFVLPQKNKNSHTSSQSSVPYQYCSTLNVNGFNQVLSKVFCTGPTLQQAQDIGFRWSGPNQPPIGNFHVGLPVHFFSIYESVTCIRLVFGQGEIKVEDQEK